jgi:transcriptional regulator with XRE-family HTH domain
MDDGWRRAEEFADRLRWARTQMHFERAGDAADSLGIKPGTYRTYERRKADGGRLPPLPEIQRIAGRLGVNWPWLATGDGRPDSEPTTRDDRVARFVEMLLDVPADRQDDAINAAEAVIKSFIRRAT